MKYLAEWTPLPESLRGVETELLRQLRSWRGTPYFAGAAVKGKGVDCVRYCCSVVDSLFGFSRCPKDTLPQDTCFHDRRAALKGMRLLRRLYEPLEIVREEGCQPADLLVVGPDHGGPGHLMIVGPEPNTLWHVGPQGPCMTGLAVPEGFSLFRHYRFKDRVKWLHT